MLSACSKKNNEIAPKSTSSEVAIQEQLIINNVNFIKHNDVYAANKEALNNNLFNYSSSFNINANGKVASIEMNFKNISKSIEVGKYALTNEGNKISEIRYFDETNIEWNTLGGHQKGASIEVLESVNLDKQAYTKQLKVKVSCFVYNAAGDYLPVIMVTTVKI